MHSLNQVLKEDEEDDDCLFSMDTFSMQRQKSKTEYQKRENFVYNRLFVQGAIQE